MVRKATWILVLLVALLVISVSAAFAANVTRPSQASLTPKQELSTSGKFQSSTLTGIGSGNYKVTKSYNHGRGDCPFDSSSDSAAAY
jgi:hypothetical protein